MGSVSYECPRGAVGNLRFTDTGVYADYLLSGLPFVFMAKDAQDRVADLHAEMLRTLPSGALLSGLTTDVSTRSITRRMLFAHPDLQPAVLSDGAGLPAHTRDWITHCRTWEPALARTRSRRRVYWLSLPLDGGLSRTAGAGTWQRRRDAVMGRDRDTEAALSRYRGPGGHHGGRVAAGAVR
jgi:hypothetical protein